MAQAIEKYGSYTLPGTQTEKSAVFVPLVVGDQARGADHLVDMEREHAFSDSDVRLLQTLANSMSVALENARLFDETQRLFKETEQRAAELAIINSVQQALAAELNMQGIYDAVGDKIREIFDQADMDIRIYDPQTNLIHYPYVYENGKRVVHRVQPARRRRALPAHVMRTRETLVINENMAGDVRSTAAASCPARSMEKSAIYGAAGGRRPGARRDRALATSSASTRSASRTCACCRRSPTHERRARKRAPLRRDAAPAARDARARRSRHATSRRRSTSPR